MEELGGFYSLSQSVEGEGRDVFKEVVADEVVFGEGEGFNAVAVVG